MRALPASVAAALEALLDGRSRRDLASRSHDISGRYRGGGGSAAVVRSDADALAYAVARMPATFAAVSFALDELRRAAPALSPETMLDAGCGPGTAAMAALAAFPGLHALDLLDHNRAFLELARRLMPDAAGDRALAIGDSDLKGRAALPPADLVTAGYVLAELPDDAAQTVARTLWAAARQALVIVEPGTPEGFRRLRAVRADLVAAGAHVAAPCTHQATCPMSGDGWCRVPVRVQRSRDHRALKGGALSYEDEPVAYLALTREPASRRADGRIVGPPVDSKAGVTLPICGADGLATLQTPSRDREKYKQFRKLRWGDAV